MSALVTIIIPTIGRPDYIRHTLAAVLGQDYSNLEILISDNSPSVPTASLLPQKLDPRINIISHAARLEFSEHMNLCLSAASGEYLMILSDDDLIGASYVSEMMSLFHDPQVKVAIGTQEIIGESDFSIKESQLSESQVVAGNSYVNSIMAGHVKSPVLTYFSLFARRQDILDAGGFNNYPDGSNADNYLFYSLAMSGLVGISSAWMGYRVYQASSGLSTAFVKLYRSTSMYDKDVSAMLYKRSNMSFLAQVKLRVMFKLSSRNMLLTRLRSIYKSKMSLQEYALYNLKVLFVFSFSNPFSGLFSG
ncbi:hypothetical protein PSEUDO8AS_40014 [Pseudomonas sp. 8AS]|uniref:glycosyltransferase family 2 protein n=1 Tax=Pseudomonas sp. 8AS TaxID=2653163 RepID=UPI0012F11B12|nr:glycosyltransferase family 2 protein [Pseudomonas sp. 8AS]VXB83243.1 hypothetical protein PSEUDO8AS_40014 [Pseudomonas sp. 8AS]